MFRRASTFLALALAYSEREHELTYCTNRQLLYEKTLRACPQSHPSSLTMRRMQAILINASAEATLTS